MASQNTYEGALQRLRELVDQYNCAQTGKTLDYNAIVAKLRTSGAVSLETLAALSSHDFTGAGLPQATARAFFSYLKPSPGGSHTKAAVDQMSLEDLVDAFDPNDLNGQVAQRLYRIARGRRVIALSGGAVNKPITVAVLKNAADCNWAPGDTFHYSGGVYQLVRVNEVPVDTSLLHPLDTDTVLRRDGCDNRGIEWGSLSERVRSILIIAVHTTFELQTQGGAERSWEIFGRVSGPQGEHYLSVVCPRAVRQFGDGEHPRLTRSRGRGYGRRVRHPVHS
jgi:hypothetical protein